MCMCVYTDIYTYTSLPFHLCVFDFSLEHNSHGKNLFDYFRKAINKITLQYLL